MWDGMGGSGFGHWGGGLLVMLLYWGIIIFVIVLLVRWLAGSASGPGGESGETPLQILKKRYARGEIDKEEFERRRRDLES